MSLKVLLIDLGSDRNELNEPIGIESIAGTLLSKIKDIHIDFNWGLLNNQKKITSEGNYDVIGISAKLGTLEKLRNVLNSFSRILKLKRVIIGGPLATFGYLQLLKEYGDLICIRGEGETSFYNICEIILNKDCEYTNQLMYIPNAVFNLNGNLHFGRRFQEDLSVLPKPFRFYLESTINAQGIVRIEGSRGCKFSKCQFCSVSENYGTFRWRPFPISFIIDELIKLSNAGCNSPYFTDEDFFGGNYERSFLLANKIILSKKENIINPQMNFFFSARINDIINSEGYNLLQKWKEAGLREIFIGFESGSNIQLRRYGKNATPSKNSAVLDIVKELQIQLDIGYILFDPEMDFLELLENIKYIERVKLSDYDSRSLKEMRAQPFTSLTNKYLQNGACSTEFDLNYLKYNTHYKDHFVSLVKELYQNWERPLLRSVYKIQSGTRGEIPSEDIRSKLKYELSRIRELDLQALKTIIKNVSEGSTENHVNILLKSSYLNKKEIIQTCLAILDKIVSRNPNPRKSINK